MWFSFPKCNNESTKGATKLKEVLYRKNKLKKIKIGLFFKLILIKVHALKKSKRIEITF